MLFHQLFFYIIFPGHRKRNAARKKTSIEDLVDGNSPKIRTVDLRYYLFRNGGRKKYLDLLYNRFTIISEVKLLSRPFSVV